MSRPLAAVPPDKRTNLRATIRPGSQAEDCSPIEGPPAAPWNSSIGLSLTPPHHYLLPAASKRRYLDNPWLGSPKDRHCACSSRGLPKLLSRSQAMLLQSGPRLVPGFMSMGVC
jgi:hypothetical protein